MIQVNEPLLDGNEKKYLMECIDTKWISSEGPFVKKFEELFSEKVSRKYGVAVSSGTAALDIAVKAIGTLPGDEVLVPSFTIISPVSAIINSGGIPVLIDSEMETWNMDLSTIESKITTKTKAILIVHIYGIPVDMVLVLKIAQKYQLKVIEDAAEMHGQTINGKPCGSFGDVSIFSFYPNKHITTGEGGMIVTDDVTINEKAKSYRNLCFLPTRRFVHEEIGWNYRMTNIQAALGVAQLERIDEFVIRKRKMGSIYHDLLKDCPYIDIPKEKTSYSDNIYWVFGILLKDNYPYDAQFIMQKLADEGVGTRPFFYPMHLQPVFIKKNMFRNEQYPNSEILAKNGFYIPSGLALSEDQINIVAKSLLEILAKYALR